MHLCSVPMHLCSVPMHLCSADLLPGGLGVESGVGAVQLCSTTCSLLPLLVWAFRGMGAVCVWDGGRCVLAYVR
jgi:hypothetical protein